MGDQPINAQTNPGTQVEQPGQHPGADILEQPLGNRRTGPKQQGGDEGSDNARMEDRTSRTHGGGHENSTLIVA